MLNKAVIDLGIIKKNAIAVKSKLKGNTKLCAVVKADAYGHGAEVISSALYPYADCFAVALLEEGIKLRLSGIDKEILCLIPFFSGEEDVAVRYGLTATVTDFSQLSALNCAAREQNTVAYAHVKFNTGMNRQGVDGLDNLKKLLDYSLKFSNLKISGLYSHFYAPEKKKAFNLQVDKFLLANNLIKGYNNNVTCHISASGGLLKGALFDMVRVGILLYGYSPFNTDSIEVTPAMKVFAPLVNKRFLSANEVALYGGKRARKNTYINLVRYGYADGLSRKCVKGQFNNRCMDLTALTDYQECAHGVSILDNADFIAQKYNTISYEILTKAALRAVKIYID